MFCMELIELTSLIPNIFRLFGFGAWGKSYGVFKSKFSVLDRQPVKMVPRHVVMTNQRHCDVNLLQTCQATIISTNHVAVWPTTLSKIDFFEKFENVVSKSFNCILYWSLGPPGHGSHTFPEYNSFLELRQQLTNLSQNRLYLFTRYFKFGTW